MQHTQFEQRQATPSRMAWALLLKLPRPPNSNSPTSPNSPTNSQAKTCPA